MNDYIRLADRINDLFELDLEPHDDTRAFVKLFRKMLSGKEAAIACCLDEFPKPASYIAEKMDISEDSAVRELRKMARKGIIFEQKDGSEYSYKLMPFVPGIFEALVPVSGDPEIAACLREYTEEVAAVSKEYKTVTIPVNSKLDIKTEAVSFEEISVYLDNHDQYAVMDCICRTVRAAEGKACGHPIKDTCILIGSSADYYVRTGKARNASREEVERILRQAEEDGLVHEMYPMNKSDSTFICNCCPCGCMFLMLSKRIHSVTTYLGKVQVDKNRCSLCGTCISRCPEHTFSWSLDGKEIAVDSSRCFECGICKLMCPEKAITVG